MTAHVHFDPVDLAASWRRDRAELNRRALESAEDEDGRAIVRLGLSLNEAELAFHLWMIEARNGGAPTAQVGPVLVAALSCIVTTFAANFPGEAATNARVLLQVLRSDVAKMLSGQTPVHAVTAETAVRTIPGGRA